MWAATTRAQHKRDGLRFASDLTDAEWAVLEPMLPAPSLVGRPPEWPMRELVNAIFYVLCGGIAWRMLPPCFPPRQTVYGWFAAWLNAGVWQAINHRLVMLDCERVGREASPSAAVIDSQSVKTSEAGGPCGDDAGKKIKGRKRLAIVDTDGRVPALQVSPASVQDRDGALPLLQASRRSFPFVERAFANTAYTADRMQSATCIAIEIVRKIPGQVGFEVHPAQVGRRTMLGLARPKPTLGKGYRGDRRVRHRLPVRRVSHATDQANGSFHISSESDFKEGGSGASVRPITRGDNRGAGASMGAQMRPFPDGTRVTVVPGKKP